MVTSRTEHPLTAYITVAAAGLVVLMWTFTGVL